MLIYPILLLFSYFAVNTRLWSLFLIFEDVVLDELLKKNPLLWQKVFAWILSVIAGNTSKIDNDKQFNHFRFLPDLSILLRLTSNNFTLVNARRFYSSRGVVSDRKGLKGISPTLSGLYPTF